MPPPRFNIYVYTCIQYTEYIQYILKYDVGTPSVCILLIFSTTDERNITMSLYCSVKTENGDIDDFISNFIGLLKFETTMLRCFINRSTLEFLKYFQVEIQQLLVFWCSKKWVIWQRKAGAVLRT